MEQVQNISSHDAVKHLSFITVDTNEAESPTTNADREHRLEKLRSAPMFSFLACMGLLESKKQEHQKHRNRENVSENRTCLQYGLLGVHIPDDSSAVGHHELMYANVSAPWSTIICGSQGSGKSHTLSCLLENGLISSSPVGKVSSPLAGLVVHYDKFTSFGGTQLCETAHLASSGIPVRVLVSPANYVAMKKAYESLPGLENSQSLEVVPMYLSQNHLTITMMKTLMGIGTGKDQPLYIEVRPHAD